MTNTITRNLLGAALLTLTASTWAAGFPVASGELSAPDLVATTTAPAAGATSTAGTQAQSQGRTRAEVLAELEAARCRGELIADGETGRTYKEVFPGRYPLPGCR
ncbi:DUF4148 domain-containing protein [Tepidimonas ignava]|uniref:DUF4148 domain-containing protein n=1 Tax=Tepidimonas ignava TaxID=114249 RepID=UPI002FD8FF61